MSIISVSNLTFAYEGAYDNVFENATFSMDTDWKLGFIGRNGRGKTTFLNLLRGLYPYQGKITSSVTFDYFPFPIENPDWLTLDIAMELYPDLVLWQLERELNLIEVDPDVLYRPFSTLSQGEQTKVMLGLLFLRENRFLLIDEPTNHLDTLGRETVSRYLQGKKGFLLVSHDRRFLDGCVDHILSINRSTIQVEQGTFSSWQRNKELRDAFELSENEKLKKDIGRLSQAAAQTAKWSDKVESTKIGTHSADRGHVGHLAAKMMKRSKSTLARRERAVEEKEKLLHDLERGDSLAIHPLSHHAGTLITFDDVTIRYGDTVIKEKLNFTLNKGDRLVLAGRNGSGKSSAIKLMLGLESPYAGQIRLASGLVISYVPQSANHLQGSLDDFITQAGADPTLFKTILRKLDFSRIQFEKNMEDYSQGQKKKVLLAASLCQQAHVYIWDEPLNYIDVISRMQIQQLIEEYNPTMVLVEHDAAFVEAVATQVIEF